MKGFGKEFNQKERKSNAYSIKKVDYALAIHAKGDIKQAIIHYNQIIKSGIEDPRVYSALGFIALQNSEIEKAIKYNLKSIAINPKYAPGYSNLGTLFCQTGNYNQAEKYIREAIKINPTVSRSFLTLSEILSKQIELNKAEKEIRKAIHLEPNLKEAYYILSNILMGKEDYNEAEKVINNVITISPKSPESYFQLHKIYSQAGKLGKARETLYKTIDLDSKFALAYDSLSRFQDCEKDLNFVNKLFSINSKELQSNKDKVNILFAKSNILHRKKQYEESAELLIEANSLKLNIYNSTADQVINLSKDYLIKTLDLNNKKKLEVEKAQECIFILGMPRSGSTLIETILNANKKVIGMGERPLIEISLKKILSLKEGSKNNKSLENLYLHERSKFVKSDHISTDKYLHNYIYLGYILNSIPYAKVIHCFRNPLDNILSIYKANFGEGIRFASSLKDCARVYKNHMKVIKEYQKRFPSNIYSLNYDSLVNEPSFEIKQLIQWLNWEWNQIYLSPQNVNRNIKTASVVQVRSPINSNSVNGWERYRKMLKPAIDELEQDHPTN